MRLDVTRHMELFDPHGFNTPVTIIGAGATGSWLALFLAKLGITDITVYDFDVVEEHNIPNQAFNLFGYVEKGTISQVMSDVGKQKVLALYDVIKHATGTEIKVVNDYYKAQRLSGVVFMMVDSMKERKRIWENCIKFKSAVKLLVEPRMGLDVGRVYNVDPMNLTHHKRYEETYYSDEGTEVSACGASVSVITSAVATASWCARQLINWHNEGFELLDNEILIDYKYNNIIPTKWGV